MTKISREEALKIARASQLELHEHEIEPLLRQLQEVLTYAERVKEIAADAQESSRKAVNVFREDLIVATDPETILALAPEREGDYFVVPKILENN